MEAIFYIIIGILIFIWQIIQESRKAKQAQPPSQGTPPVHRQPGQTPPPVPPVRKPEKPVSFDDLIKQSQEKGRKTYEEKIKPPVSKSIRKAEKAFEAGKSAYVNEEEEALKKIERDRRKMESLESQPIKSVVEVEEVNARNKKRATSKYAALFHNKENLKTMIVASEILNRKYF